MPQVAEHPNPLESEIRTDRRIRRALLFLTAACAGGVLASMLNLGAAESGATSHATAGCPAVGMAGVLVGYTPGN